MKSLKKIAEELRKQFAYNVSIKVDEECKTIDVCKPNYNLWCQVDFDRLNQVMTDNGLIMWMRLEVIENNTGLGLSVVPVFHLHREK